MSVQDLRQDPMMAHLLDALDSKKDIGHYGRLVFAMVGQYFMSKEELTKYLQKDPNVTEDEAKSLVAQVQQRGYNPPRRDKILAWQKEQDFPICPNPEDPDACNVYKNLKFPDDLYEDISEYREQKAEATES